MSEEEIKTDHFKTMEELLEHLKMWERDDDYEAYCRFFDYECAYAMAHYIDKLQKELDNSISKDIIRNKIKELEEEYEEYKGGQEWEIQDNLEIQIEVLEELLERYIKLLGDSNE